MLIEHIQPQFGHTHHIGYVGFTFDSTSIISHGIAYFTRWESMSQIKVAHSLIVTGRNRMIEAHHTGVREHTLDDIFADPHRMIVFRKPQSWTPDLGQAIADTAAKAIGDPYEFDLFIAHGLAGTFIGRLLNLKDKLGAALDTDGKWICSEHVAFCLAEQPELKGAGCLAKPDGTIVPQELFEDDSVFQPWKNNQMPNGDPLPDNTPE